jgi:N-acyl-phosphatidylethanolamine-hydrolysing phospholipase D
MPRKTTNSHRMVRGLSRRALTRQLAAMPLALAGCAGPPPAGATGRPWHHTAEGFRNPPGSPVRGGDFGEWSSFFWRGFSRAPDAVRVPEGHVLAPAEVRAGLHGQNGADAITWLGHASFLIRLDGITILTDPFLSDHASPVPPLGPARFAPPGLRVYQLPPIDIVLLSHNHYDHLDLPTIDALSGKERIQAIVPLRLSGYLTERGYPRVRELDWGERASVDALTITSLPAIHFSKRGLFDRNRTLWAGYAVQGRRKRLHFAGDTAYGKVFAQLGRELEPFDLSLLPIGAYEPRELMRATHATPEEAVRIAGDLRARRLVGMHWGSIQLTDEPPFEPPDRFLDAARKAGYGENDVWILRIGETRPI